MSKIKVEINIDGKKIANEIITKGVRIFANEDFWRLYEDFVPMREGDLYNDTDIDETGIYHKVPYAKKMYNGEKFNFSTQRHPKATAKWDKVAFISQGEILKRDIEAYIKSKRR